MLMPCKCRAARTGKDGRYEYIEYCSLHANAERLFKVVTGLLAEADEWLKKSEALAGVVFTVRTQHERKWGPVRELIAKVKF